MSKDFSGLYSKWSYNLKLRINYLFYNVVNYISYTIQGINVGSKCRFYGRTYFHRKPHSKISIGKSCGFRSSQFSNLIGINRKCSVSTLSGSATIRIGNKCGFSGTVIGSESSITIGNNVRCGANTLITDSDWHSDDPRSGIPRPVNIKDNVWLGVNAIVLKGVTIGENSVIGAGSIVTKDIPANVIAAGNPCKVIRSI